MASTRIGSTVATLKSMQMMSTEGTTLFDEECTLLRCTRIHSLPCVLTFFRTCKYVTIIANSSTEAKDSKDIGRKPRHRREVDRCERMVSIIIPI